MTKKKLLSLLLVAPVILTGACNTDSSSSSSSDSSSSDSSSTTPVIEENITNWQKDGHLSVQLGGLASETGNYILFEMPLFPHLSSHDSSEASTKDGNYYIVNYNSALTAAYSKSGDDIFQYYGDDANFDLRLYPGQAYATSDSFYDADIVKDNYESLDNIYNLFDWSVFELFSLGIDTDSFPDYYKNGGIVYGDLADSAAEDIEYLYSEAYEDYEVSESELIGATLNNSEKYQREIAVSLLGGTDGYFTDTNPSLENDDILGYSEFTLGGSDSDDSSSSSVSSIISTILGLLGSDDLDIDWTQLDLPGIINLLFSFGIIPDFNFDVADYPVVGYIVDIIRILGKGLTAEFVTDIEDEEGNLHQTLTLGLNDDGLEYLTEFLSEEFLDDLLSGLASVTVTDLSLALDFVNGGSTWEVGGVSLYLGVDLTLWSTYTAPLFLDVDLAFDPGETELEDTYFTDLGNLYEGYEAYIADNAAGDSEDSENPDDTGDDEEIGGE